MVHGLTETQPDRDCTQAPNDWSENVLLPRLVHAPKPSLPQFCEPACADPVAAPILATASAADAPQADNLPMRVIFTT